MKKNLFRGVILSIVGAFAMGTAVADNHEPPFIPGDYWEVSGIKVADGARADESDLYLITVFENMATVEEGEARRKAWMEFSKKNMEQWQKESGNRAEYRTLMSDQLLRHMKFRD